MFLTYLGVIVLSTATLFLNTVFNVSWYFSTSTLVLFSWLQDCGLPRDASGSFDVMNKMMWHSTSTKQTNEERTSYVCMCTCMHGDSKIK